MLRTSVNSGTKGARKKVDDGPKEYKAMGVFVVEGPVLVGGLCLGANRVWHAEPLEVVH